MYRNPTFLFLILSLGMIMGSCESTQKDSPVSQPAEPLFREIKASQSGLDFVNQLSPSDTLNILEFNYYFNGGGVGAGDFNGDGLPDLFFAGNQQSAKFYLNQGALSFQDQTVAAGLQTEGWTTGVSVVDINADGRLDLYVCRSAPLQEALRKNLLFINQGNDAEQVPQFSEEAAAYGLADAGYGTQAVFWDYDRDGDLDLYLLNTWHDKTNPNMPRPIKNNGKDPSMDRLFQNEGMVGGKARFRERGVEAGIVQEGYGLGVKVADLNQDGWPDLYVANDFIFNDRLYLNQQNGTFKEIAAEAMRHTSRFSMGVDIADLNQDGRQDIFTLDMLPEDNYRQKTMNSMMNYDLYHLSLRRGYMPQFSRNVLQVNLGEAEGVPQFSEQGFMAGVARTDWSWHAEFADLDLDGYLDLAITNGIPRDITDSDFISYRFEETKGDFQYKELKKRLLSWVEGMPPVYKSNPVFKQLNNSARFEEVTQAWGLEKASMTQGALCIDLDLDGDLDWVGNNLNEPAMLWENLHRQRAAAPHYLSVAFEGPKANPEGYGTEVRIYGGDISQTLAYQPVRGFQSSAATGVLMGLGDLGIVDSLIVTWPDGRQQVLAQLPADSLYTLKYAEAKTASPRRKVSPQPLLKASRGLQITHTENEFNEFNHEPLLLHMQAHQGPSLAVADVNGDGTEDVYLGGSAGQAGQLLLQQTNGSFVSKTFEDPNFEDAGALFFDVDLDGDQDLYVSSGGTEYNANTAAYQDRLYLNDGQGNFTRSREALPRLYSSASCVRATDWDQDGDLDLFVGGRVVPANYPLAPRSYLLRNNRGIFTEISSKMAPDLAQIGMVKDAIWTDLDADGDQDLMVVGPWMPLSFFKFDSEKEKLEPWKLLGQEASGWWTSILPWDYDRDGDMDYLIGNMGLNTRYSASESQPFQVHFKDFDGNQRLDPVFSRYLPAQSGELQPFPVASRDVMIKQVPKLGKRFPQYKDFAQSTVSQVFDPEIWANTPHLAIQHLESSLLVNLGTNVYHLTPLPEAAQHAPLMGMQSIDLDADGQMEVLALGNFYATELVGGPHSGSAGYILDTDAQGEIQVRSCLEAGYAFLGDMRSLVVLEKGRSGTPFLLAAENQAPLHGVELPATSGLAAQVLTANRVRVQLPTGESYLYEAPYGAGYLSQGTRRIFLPKDASLTAVERKTPEGL